jgi:hypothetical protein
VGAQTGSLCGNTFRVAPLSTEDYSGSVGEYCISEALRRTGICIFATTTPVSSDSHTSTLILLLLLRPKIIRRRINQLHLTWLIQSLVSHNWVILLNTRHGGRSFSLIILWMLLPRFCSLAHLCPLLGFVLMSLNTGHHEVEGMADIHLSVLGPRSRQIRFIFNNRYMYQQTHLFVMTSWLYVWKAHGCH